MSMGRDTEANVDSTTLVVTPSPNCPFCPRLASFRQRQRDDHTDWFNSPVPSFGDSQARLLVVGLAPGLRGANRTGRPFTGDYAGDLLYATLQRFRFAHGIYRADPQDGLKLIDCMMSRQEMPELLRVVVGTRRIG